MEKEKSDKLYLSLLLVVTVAIAFLCTKMSPFYPFQEWSDVNLYFNIGKAIMNGQTLYLESFDHKGPFIFLIYGIGYLISNSSFSGVFIIQIITWISIVLSAYYIGKLFLSNTSSFVVSVLFLPLFISHTLEGGSAEEFITGCMAISLFLFIKFFIAPEKHRLFFMFIHGAMWGIVFLTKFNLTVFWIFPLLSIVFILIRNKEYKNLYLNILSFVAGGLLIILPFLIYFVSKSAFYEAIDAYFILNSNFKAGGFTDIINKIVISFYQRFRFETIEFSVILLGACVFPFLCLKNMIARISLILTFFSVFSMAFIGGYIYYYSIPYYLFAILGLIVMMGYLSSLENKINKTITISLAVFISIGVSIYKKDFFGEFVTNKQPTVIETFLPAILADTKDRTLINLGLDEANALFTYANIMPNVRYFISPNLPYEVYPQLRDEQTRYIEEKKTNFIVLAEYTINAEYFLNLEILKKNYELVNSYKEYYAWHNVDRYFYLYKRKDK